MVDCKLALRDVVERDGGDEWADEDDVKVGEYCVEMGLVGIMRHHRRLGVSWLLPAF
ncbi:MAG: hypothetical protein HC898_11285 [Phycisphaerales bacterium]|nr:hypothetical protein [Phycisphaerales bacterium]